ncbi:MAG: DUF45 domain-containing protein [Chloroflexi bacterium]|nr:DUF45 domain-containing protein [Chloroflexota bacterium]
MQTAAAAASDVAQKILEYTEPYQDWIDPFQERLYNVIKDTTFIRELQRDARKQPVQSMLAAALMDWVYDLTSVVLGHDLMTGQKLSHGEELLAVAAIAIPVLSVAAIKLGPKMLKAGSRLASHGDELIEGVEFAAKHADELGDAARFATKHSDELADAVTWSARHGDDLSEARLAQRLDDEYVTTLARKSEDEVDFIRPYSGSDHTQTYGASKNNKYQIDDSNSPKNSSLDDFNNIDREGLVNEALHILESTPEGKKMLSEARKLGMPKVEFRKMNVAGGYNDSKNVITLNQQFLHAQPEVIAPTLAHELTHRIHRWNTASIDDELLSFGSQARVWSDLQKRVSSKNLSGFALDRYNQNNKILDFSRRQDNALRNYIRGLYPDLPKHSRSLIDDPYYKLIIQNKGL